MENTPAEEHPEEFPEEQPLESGITRRDLLIVGGVVVAAAVMPAGAGQASAAEAVGAASTASATSAAPSALQMAMEAPVMTDVAFEVNGKPCALRLDTRTSLLDALREHLKLTGTKKGCDHGQCGACTVMVEGQRINSCLSLAVMHQGQQVTTIEGLGTPEALHPMQAAFVKHDGYQCGYCTPGQICSAVATLREMAAGIPSHATGDLNAPVPMDAAEIRERMSGNLCRCGAYSNIIQAIAEVAAQGPAQAAGENA